MKSSSDDRRGPDDHQQHAIAAVGQQNSRRSSRFGSINKTASSSSFFQRSLKKKSQANSELTSSITSLPDKTMSEKNKEEKKNCAVAIATSATPQLNEIGSRFKAALKRLRQDGKAEEFKTNRRLSRKSRSSFVVSKEVKDLAEVGQGATGRISPAGYMHLPAAAQRKLSCIADASPNSSGADSIEERLLGITVKENFCDIEITGKDNIVVRAPGVLLACHSSVFEEIFNPKGGESKKTLYSFISQSDAQKLCIGFASQPAIKAAIHFCATFELPPSLENEANETNIRIIKQIHLFAQLFKIPGLVNEAFRTARRLMNKNPSTVCAAFDECNSMLEKAQSENFWGLTLPKQGYEDLKSFVLDFLRESPLDAILGGEGGVSFLSSVSIEALICDQEMDFDEYTMWLILNSWVKNGPGNDDSRTKTAKSLVSHIELIYIDPVQLKYQVKKCGYVDPEDVDEALRNIDLMLENKSSDDKERVIVEGAGDDTVNGVYILADDDIGLKGDDVMFLKEGEDDLDFCSDYGLYRWGDSWGISNCTDYFNILYSHEVQRHKGHTRRKPPKWGWKCDGGQKSAPTCTWKPSKEEDEQEIPVGRIAPPLSEHKKEKGKMDPTASCGYAFRDSLTLSQMMMLPEDEDSEELHRYASGLKDLNAMMNLSVDEGFDDNESGYDINYMSATLLLGSKSQILENPETKP